MNSEYLSQLNPQQRAAVEYIDGPALVIAGAGSGKTRVLTYKIVHLLANGYEPWRVLALTFTNKAAREMRDRIEQLVGHTIASRIWMGTFHSVFARILRSHAERIGYKPNYTIYDAADSKALVKTIIKDMQLDEKVYKPSTVLSAISTAKNALISPEDYVKLDDVMAADRQARRPLICSIYRTYRNRCLTAGAMDFDDLLFNTNRLLRENPDVLHHYQEFFRYVLVDEYQDTNYAQHVIVSMLCDDSHRLCVVGDDAQSIYSFRGANIRNILNLRNAYPELHTFKLEQNYRSTQNIINAANSLIEKNSEQIRKKVFSTNAVGDKIEVVQAYSDLEEGYLVANRISQVKMRTSDSYEDFAILYRTNAQSRVLEESLRKRNIPYRIYGGLSFYQRKEIKDAIAYFRLAVNPDDDEALRRIINFPARGIGETSVTRLLHAAIESNRSMWQVLVSIDDSGSGLFKNPTLRKLKEFRSMVQSFIMKNQSGDNAELLAAYIIERTGMMTLYASERTPENISRQENLTELMSGVSQFVSERTEEGSTNVSMTDFLGEVSLATDQDSEGKEDEERITLMTMHAAKGLEFNNVFIVGAEEELLPSSMSRDSISQIEEERRLLYVAITRARKYCMISYASSRYRNGMTTSTTASRFLKDINHGLLKLSSGANIDMPRPNFASFESSYHSYRRSTSGNGSRNLWDQSRSSAQATPRPQMRPVASSVTPPSPSKVAGTSGLHSASEITEGMIIEHNRFGRGTVTNVDTTQPDARITVEFDNTGNRILLLKFARFTIIS